nr:hypothetical protein [Bacteroidales bacterium]
MRDVLRKKLAGKKIQGDFKDWVRQEFSDTIEGENIPNGFTYSGTRKYLPHDLDTVVKLMKKGLKDGEGFNYGVGSIRAVTSKQFKSLSGIKKDREKLISQESMEAVKQEVDDEFFKLAEDLRPFYKYDSKHFGYYDQASGAFKEFARRGIWGFNEYYEGVPDDLLEEVRSFLQKLASMPTEYFEAKIQRAVELNEFEYAIIPKGTKKETRDALKNNGLIIKTYDGKSSGDRAKTISTLNKVLFQEAEGPILPEDQSMADLIETHYREDYIQGYSDNILQEYNAALKKAVVKAMAALKKIHDKEDQVSLRNIKKEAENIAASSGVFRAWSDAISEGGLNLETAKMTSDKETVNDLMLRRPGLFKKGSALHAEHYANRLGFDTADEMFQEWLRAGTKRDVVNRIMDDMVQEYEYTSEIGRDLTRREDLYDLEMKALGKILLKRKPVDRKIKGVIRRVSGQTRDEVATITEREALKTSLMRSAQAAKKALRLGDKQGVEKEKNRMRRLLEKAATNRKRSATIKQLKAKIKKEIKLSKAKKVSGKMTGKFTPEIQDTLNTLIAVSKLKKDEAEAKLVANLEKYQEEVSEDILIENHLLEMVARLDTMDNITGLQSLLDEIKALKDEGRLINDLKAFNRSEQARARVEATIEDLGGLPEGLSIR